MASLLRCKGAVGLLCKPTRAAGRTLVVAKSENGDTPSSSGRDLSCSGKPVGFGTLRKGFKPQPKKAPAQQTRPTVTVINGRDKADVLRETRAELAGQAQSAPNDDPWADWKRVDAKVNKYPCERQFTAVGSGGDDFQAAMTRIVEEVVQGPVPVDVRASSGGAYVSVRLGPVRVQNREQVLEIFNRMREDKRLKFHL